MGYKLNEDIVLIHKDSKLFKEIRNIIHYQYSCVSFNITEFGLRWVLGTEFSSIKDNHEVLKHKCLDQEFLFLVIDKKRWLRTLIEYGN